MNPNNNLELLLKELRFKLPLKEITSQTTEVITNFLQTEWEYRHQYKIKTLLKMSGIRQVKTLSQFDWHFNPKIAKDSFLGFLNSSWIEQAFNLILIGDTGLGKSHLASALSIFRLIPPPVSVLFHHFFLIKLYNSSCNLSTIIF